MSMEQRVRRHFHDELEVLQQRLLEMAGMVEESVAWAAQAVLDRDASVAPRVKATDIKVDALEVEIDERVVELLALQQPMAKDLRRIITTNKVSNDLERVGDHAVNISKAARRLSETQPLPELRELAEMITITREMLADSLAAYVSQNTGTARMVCVTDDKVDDLRRSLFRILVTFMLEDPKRISGALELLLVSQNLERIADLATNIAEDVVFLVEGESIKHGAQGHLVRDPDEGPVESD
ncbi:MAG: phosphate signaling complex protein PhoU [Gemmatimonadota bacterium]|nr:phosphate signaling complex protein PhoU [Gemmatimonadota bacterium]MDH5758724.1 phosphate signaling complex protein PhoU [Gemmatimonadota bacterium]